MGSVHDFKLCKETLLTVLMLSVMILADSGYQGIQEYHAWSLIPIKKSKNRELSEAEKAFNKELSRRRIIIENINAKIKVFKIMSQQYRNRRKTHLLRTKLVCAILNEELPTEGYGTSLVREHNFCKIKCMRNYIWTGLVLVVLAIILGFLALPSIVTYVLHTVGIIMIVVGIVMMLMGRKK